MPASIAVVLSPCDSTQLVPENVGRMLRSWMYHSIRQIDPAIAQMIHSTQGPKPFTVSQLIGPGKRQNGMLQLHSGPYIVRITTLTDELYSTIQRSLMLQMSQGHKLLIDHAAFDFVQIRFGNDGDTLAMQTDWDAIGKAGFRETFDLRFVTPTSFRVGKNHLPLPTPVSVYRSLWNNWNSFAPASHQMGTELLRVVESQVFPTEHRLRTRALADGNRKFIGFVGNCRFSILGDVSDKSRAQLATLTDFAFFAGVGSKTTEGMGQTLVGKPRAGFRKESRPLSA